LDRKWKNALRFAVVVTIIFLAGFYVFALSRPQPDPTEDYPSSFTNSGTIVAQPFYAEVDATTIVSSVIDGDTFDTTSEGRIRLADIDAPEYWESGYDNAKDFLVSLVGDKTVYLDIDDVHRTDKYGRLVCVVYVEYNSTHMVNVNKALLVEGHATIWDFDNEFDPDTWNLCCPKESIR
jgi:endonuclease YncB( thermonuclease family)